MSVRRLLAEDQLSFSPIGPQVGLHCAPSLAGITLVEGLHDS